MKIIRAPEEKHEFESSCHGCGTVVEIGATDLRYVGDQREGDAVVWRCPTCKKEVWIAASIVPPAVIREVRQRPR